MPRQRGEGAGAEYFPKEERDIKSRGPFGKWPKDDEPTERLAHAGEVTESGEEALIARIDADKTRKKKDRASVGARALTPAETAEMDDPLEAEQRHAEQMERAAMYLDPNSDKEINPDQNLHLSSRAEPNPNELVGKANKSSSALHRKRNPNKERISKESNIRKHIKQKKSLESTDIFEHQ